MPLTLVQPDDGTRNADALLAQRITQGDRRALEALMRRYNQRLYRVARSILRNEADAEEVVQEAFYKAYRALGGFRGDASLSTWLVRIVVNESKGRLRKINRLATWLEYSVDSPDALRESNMVDYSSPQPEPALAGRQTLKQLEVCIDHLPDTYRAVFILRAVEELSVEEVASCLDIPPATVRTRYFRARNLLRKSLQADANIGAGGVFSFAGSRCDRIVAGVMARLDAVP
jgi:RNA polymerase sigma-70 factor (ECF subfamily)